MKKLSSQTDLARGGLRAGTGAADALFVDVINTIREPILVLDAALRVTHANTAFFRTFLVDRADTIGNVLFSLGDGQWDIAALRELLLDKLVIHPQLHDFEVDHVFPGIGRKVMVLNASVMAHGPNAERTILLAIEDVTARRFAEWRLAEHARELERSNAALDEFATVASHDLQEPLRKIMSFGERLNRSLGAQLEGDARHSLERMLDAAGRMRVLVTDVLAYSQVTTRTLPFVATDLAWVARDAITDLEETIAATGGRIDVGVLPVVEADPLQMRQLFQNLLGNALKYRRADTPPIVKVACVGTVNGHCTLTFTDNGIGFEEEFAEKIFLMFERLHGRSRYSGTGIGLAICRRIAERHGGTIVATGISGRGATFTVNIPVTHTTPGFGSS